MPQYNSNNGRSNKWILLQTLRQKYYPLSHVKSDNNGPNTLIVCCWHACRSALVSLNSLARIVALSQLSFSRVVALLEEGPCVFSPSSACACGRVVKDTKITMVDTSTIIEGTVKFRDGKKVRILSFSNFKICVDCLNIIRYE